MSCCRFSRNWRKPWRLGWTPAKRFPDQPQNLLYALRCKQYLLAWARKWRMAGSNPWCIIQPRRCLWKVVFHDHASPRTADFFVNNHRGLELRFGIQRVGMKTCRASLLGKQCKGSNRTTVPCAPANVRNSPFSCSLQTQARKLHWGLQGKQEAMEVILELANRQQEQQLGTTTSSFYVLRRYAC